MAAVRIVTDSTADIPKEIREQLGIEMVPLKVHFGEETFLDSVTIEAEQFYTKLEQADQLPTTSQPSPVDFMDVYKRLIKEDPDAQIISIHLSSALSGTYQSAVLARNMLEIDEQITVWDSKSASYGFGLLVVAAAKAAQSGKTKDEVLEVIREIKGNMALYFLVDTLEYLQKGGRIGKAAAMLGSLLNIKPILSIDEEGEVASVDKVRGQKKAFARIVDMLKQQFGDQEIIVIEAHAKAENYADAFKALLEQHFAVRSVQYTTIGPVIGTHVGTGTLGVFICPATYAEYL
ncbi:DegV family protein [Marinicrinis lubricantis]|uniref:DegV family protein n=1 Tax=Marinicrinis lubricantis TaxID=2086470 RepID=A0ABW1IMM0_9BACL